MDKSQEEAVRILEAHIHDMDENIRNIRAIKEGAEILLEMFRIGSSRRDHMEHVRENRILELTEPLPLEKHHLKEERRMNIAKEMTDHPIWHKWHYIPSASAGRL